MPKQRVLSKRRQKVRMRKLIEFAVACNLNDGLPTALDVFEGRRSLRKALTPWLAGALVEALSPAPPIGEISIVLLPDGQARVTSKCNGGPDSSGVPVPDVRAGALAAELLGELRNRLAGLTREGLSRGPLGTSR